jgi:serine/threonine-protein kinase
MPRPGYIVGGKYRLDREIGKGGFGVVYRAEAVDDGAVVAIKLVSLNDEGQVAAEQRGAEIQQTFWRQRGMVPQVFDIGSDDHYLFIAMELIQAPTLAALLRRKPLDPESAAQHAIGLCRFLERAHTFEAVIGGEKFDRIIHGDLTSSNVFVLADRTIKVLDFGIAKALEADRRVKTMPAMTPPYVSPQRLETGHGSEQDDCWALGVIVYEMIAGRRPHASEEDPQNHYAGLSRAIRSNAVREPLPDTCPAGLAAIIDKLLNVRESARYSSAVAVRHDLEAFLDQREPVAMAQYCTPVTVVRPAGAPAAVGSALPLPATIPATLPRPVTLPLGRPGGAVGVIDPAVAASAPAAIAIAPRQPGIIRRVAWAFLLLGFIAVFTSEAVGWLAAERFRTRVDGLDLRDIPAAHENYERLRAGSPLRVASRLRIDEALGRRLVTLADGVLNDFRREDSTIAEAQWRQAAAALDWASELLHDQNGLKARQLICAGHLDRIAAQGKGRGAAADARALYARAVDEFTQAAALDPKSPDPYLGLSRIYIYGLNDVDGAAKAIGDAESRGHKPGWRDRAQLGDGYLRRADDRRQKASALEGDGHVDELKGARADYLQCVATFEPILDKGRARRNRDYCQRHADAITSALGEEGDPK